jgi:hypothetical protein
MLGSMLLIVGLEYFTKEKDFVRIKQEDLKVEASNG